MKKIIIFPILILTILILATTQTNATDLPIDMDAIGRQDTPIGRVTERIGSHLFSPEADRINEALALRILNRQQISLTLFQAPPIHYTPDPHTIIMETTYNMALFSQPLNITTFGIDTDDSEIPMWLIVIVLAICAIGGFLLALHSSAKKRRQEKDVY